jgi:hypothetical protein
MALNPPDLGRHGAWPEQRDQLQDYKREQNDED